MTKQLRHVSTFRSEWSVKAMSTTSAHGFQQLCSIAAVRSFRSPLSACRGRWDVEIRRRDTTILVALEVRQVAKFIISAW